MVNLRRSRRRKRERGAAVFIVVLAILLLTSIGMWSMSSASMADQGSGFGRASLQTQAAAELGLTAAMSYLIQFGQDAYARALSGRDRCSSTGTGVPCRRLLATQELESLTQLSTGRPLLAAPTTTDPGSLGFRDAPHHFVAIELSDFREAQVAGEDATKPLYMRTTVTAIAQLRPGSAATALCSTGENSVASVVRVRSHALIGPIPRKGR